MSNLEEQYKLQEEFKNACKNGDLDTVHRLLTNPTLDPAGGERGSYWHQEPIKFACVNGHADIVQLLLKDPRVDPTGVPLESIAARGHTGVMRLLLQDGRANPAKFGMMPLKVASFYGHLAIVQLLLQDPRINPSSIRKELVGETIYKGGKEQIEVAKLLLADPRINPRITPAKARLLETIPVRELEPIIAQYPYEFEQLLTSVDHLIEKKGIHAQAKNLITMKRTEKRGFGNLSNNIRLKTGSFLSGKVGPNLQSQINQLKTNYYGPTKQTRKRRTIDPL